MENLEKLFTNQSHNIKVYSYGGNESLESNEVQEFIEN